jgi:hypothetical protein
MSDCSAMRRQLAAAIAADESRRQRFGSARNGVASAAFAIISSVRPGTKSVCTMPGATTMTRISGPSTRANAMLMVLSAAFDAP